MGQSVRKDTRKKLLDAGKGVIFRKGFHGARVSDITASAGLAHGTFYLYFRSKEDFLLELLRSLRDSILGLVRRGREMIEEGKREEGSRLIFVDSFRLLVEEKELAKILFFEAICTDMKFQEFYKKSKELLFGEMERSLRALGVREPSVKAHILVGTAKHLIELLILHGVEVSGLWEDILKELGIYF